eukprot:TRINITY_DN63796_c0_g1_i1.p1 TRINITY_DN63796_c0_g1~~TRINITY_DN63796_c0_g1_i1.p1  ORF type:complete len:1621 (+),score=362.08 TRINITY_DN63796_c0_g1_i1:388-4863(+)
MAGYSGITVGKIYERYVYLPIHAITNQRGKRVNTKGRWFFRMMETTNQPDFSLEQGPSPESPSSGAQSTINVLQALSTPGSINELVRCGDVIRRLEVVNLNSLYESAEVDNPVATSCKVHLNAGSWSTQTFMRHNRRDDRGHVYHQTLRSGIRQKLHFDPKTSSAVIVTCGGLCPGLNSVIRELVMALTSYGVKNIYGCKGGYKGMVQPDKWITLTPALVKDIHKEGGTILVSDRGNPPHIEIAKTLQKMDINQYFVIGGDGTQTGAFDTFTCTQEIGHDVAVVGIPKTIDNDIPILDRSFGFNTAAGEAERAIDAAYVESICNANCIGLVKLMGRHCGFIATHATISARNVDICLIPEMDISLPRVFTHAMHLLKTKGRAVIVVAEGCGDTMLKSSGGCDAGGNKKLADVGPWFKDQLLSYFKRMQQPLTVKYIDPTYTIRAVPANANDSVYCTILASHAVHVAMAGYTGCVVGKVDERYVMLPTHAITRTQARRVDVKGTLYERMVATTRQPNLSPGPGDDWALLPQPPPPKPSQPEVPRPEMVDFSAWTGIKSEGGSKAPVPLTTAVPGVKMKILDGRGAIKEERDLNHGDVVKMGDEVRRLEAMKLSHKFQSRQVQSPLASTLRFANFMDENAWAVEATSLAGGGDSVKGTTYHQVQRAGPRKNLHFDPQDHSLIAAIVTCGGLVPGENVVIREIFHMLKNYGVRHVYGVRRGFQGLTENENWMELTPDFVQEIHNQGGTVLQCESGQADHREMANMLKMRGVRQLFVLGGDGAHKGVLQLQSVLFQLEHECAVVAVPCTVDNDIHMVTTSFGFDSASTEAGNSISAAYVEATCNANCIGLVKLPGSDTGHLAINATLASRNVDICLIPEMEIDLEKVLDHCEQLMQRKGYAVIVVADGAGQSLFRLAGLDSSNDVGPWLRDKILERFKEKNKPLTIKYIDPMFMVRCVKADAYDSAFCGALAEHAVHGAMAGFTSVSVVRVYERFVYIPIHACVLKKKKVNALGRWFGRMLFTTGQPSFEPEGFTYGSAESADMSHLSTPLAVEDVLLPGSTVCRLECVNLADTFASKRKPSSIAKSLPMGTRGVFVGSDWWSTQTFQRGGTTDTSNRTYLQMRRAGPMREMHFDVEDDTAAAAIVTCGGLCPGLNNVIREVVKMLHAYGVKKVYGIIGGYKGCVEDDKWIELTDDFVQDIHLQGGSILVSDRGNPPHSEIAKVMKRRNIKQYFVLGGDGTHKGAMQSFDAMTEIGHECAVVGVPKTIDNDITILDRTFGFDTACTEARKAIDSAYVEATTNANCIGLVKLMGRHCGWIAATSTIAARNVDICLIPEMNISLPKLLNYAVEVMKKKKYCVIVVAEGCGDTLISGTGEKDAGGNAVLGDVGAFLKTALTNHFKEVGHPCALKYIDPTYMIRSVPANAFDSIYCSVLAQMAVHSAMSGYTGITVGKVDDRYVMLPVHSIVDKGARKVDLNSFAFERLMSTTRQPSFEP